MAKLFSFRLTATPIVADDLSIGQIGRLTTEKQMTDTTTNLTSTEIIKAAVEPMRSAAVEFAVQCAEATVEKLIASSPVGVDFNELFPRPNSHMNRRDYISRREERGFASRFLDREHSTKLHAPEPITGVNEQGVARYLDEVRVAANADFDAYVAKLSKKVGDIVSATVYGRALWNGSTLTVKRANAAGGLSSEQWVTRQIVNVSSLGRLFNQWPTRCVSK